MNPPNKGKALLLINPYSRRGALESEPCRQLLHRAGLEVLQPEVPEGVSASNVIQAYANQVDRVIVGGGDGSLNGAAAGIIQTGLPLGVLPLGTANDFARTMGIPLDMESAVRVACGENTVRVDLGLANGNPFFNVASIGFSADLASSLTASAKRRWGKLGYAITAARILAASNLFEATLEHDGTVEKLRTFQVSVGNGRYYGGGMAVHHDATAMDGLLDFYSLEVSHWWRLLWLLPAIRKGTHSQWDEVRAFSTKALTIRTRAERPVNLDGELRTQTPVVFKLAERAVKVFVPQTL